MVDLLDRTSHRALLGARATGALHFGARVRCLVAAAALLVSAAGCGSSGHAGPDSGAVHAGPVRAWSSAEALEDDHSDQDDHPSVALNASGDGVVAWQRGPALWIRMYAGTSHTFGPAVLVASPSRYDDLQVGIDAQGNVMLVWARDDADSTQGVWWSRSTDHGVTWSLEAPIALGKLHRCRLAVSPNGTALATWTVRSADDVIVSVGSSDFKDGVWNPVVNVPLPGTGLGDRNPRVALDGSGRGFLIWEQPAEVNAPSSVWTERYDGGWLPASVAVLDQYSADDSYTPTVALNEAGAATALWLEMWDFVPQLWSRRFDGNSWSEPMRLGMAPLIEWDPPPMVAIDPNGGSVAVWSQVASLDEMPQYYDVHAARYRASAGQWQAPEALETDNLIGADLTEYAQPLIGMDADGNAIATWRKEAPSSAMQMSSSRFEASGSGWVPESGAPLDADPTHSAFATDLAVSSNGSALAAWSVGPEYDIMACVYR